MEKIKPDFPVISVEVDDGDDGTNNSGSDVIVDLTQPGPEPHLVDPRFVRELGASKIGRKLLAIFAQSLVWSFFGGLLIIASVSLTHDVEAATEVLVQAYLPLLERIGDLALRVFGPLLGFVLGYYFGRGKK